MPVCGQQKQGSSFSIAPLEHKSISECFKELQKTMAAITENVTRKEQEECFTFGHECE